jgi:hypothetical protein
MLFYLFIILYLFNNAVNISSCVESNYGMMMDYEHGKDMEGSSDVNV